MKGRNRFEAVNYRQIFWIGVSVALLCGRCGNAASQPIANGPSLQLPQVGQNELRVLSPNLLELRLITTKALTQSVGRWNFVSTAGQLNALPGPQEFVVRIAGRMVPVSAVGFKRRPLYAPLADYDLRIDNRLYLELATNIADNQTVAVQNPDASLWAPTMTFTATADPLRFNPAIHVNQVGYAPGWPKEAMVGYYLGSLGEMDVTATNFEIVDARTGAPVFTGPLTPRPDTGFNTTPLPYQKVLEADFSSFTNAGDYKLVVPGLGASYPFAINDGVAAAFARAFALGLYEQRSGTNVALPFTRFTHPADHTAPASVPLPESAFSNAWAIIASHASKINPDNPPQAAPLLTNAAAQLYPFVNTGAVDVSGGHFDAGDYSKYTWDSAQLIHTLMFAVDSLPGVSNLDNLGIPESGDGISDLMEEAKWEADFLAKMQDADGGFYYLVYPRNREYENNVLPQNGDPQIVWPKNTVATAAAVAALAQCASSPLFKKTWPATASNYLAKAELGWQFLVNATDKYGIAGSYQRLIHYGDDFTATDELAWAACELYLATGDSQYQQALFQLLPDPTNPGTFKYGWWRMYQCFGNAIRDYAFAVRSGRLTTNEIDPVYLDKCETEIVAAAQDQLTWAQDCAYGSSFPLESKAIDSAGWYFSLDQAFDLAVASALNDYPPLNDPRPQFFKAILSNLNYEAGCNPVNVCHITGLGWKRQRTIVNQYALNDGRVLPPSGIPIGNIVSGFDYLSLYQGELGALCFPLDGAPAAPYPLYDRWGDSWSVETEPTILDQARALATAAWLMAQTPLATQAWRPASAQIVVPATVVMNSSVTAAIQVAEPDLAASLSNAVVVWEAQGQQPAFGANFIFTPSNPGSNWVEVEAQWPDGRRVFAATNFFSTNEAIVAVAATGPLALAGTTNYGTFTFTRSGDTSAALTVYYTFSGVADFEQSITFAPGASSCTVNIVPVGDYPASDLEAVALTLAGGAGYEVGPQSRATVSIVNLVADILKLARSPPDGFTLQWTSVPGFTYRVVFKNHLTDANWADLSGDILAVSTNTSWTDFSTTGVPQRFYAVQGTGAGGLQIYSVTPSPAPDADGMTLGWTSLPGQVYEVMFKNSLGDTNWTDLSGPITATDTITSWTDSLTTGVPRRFYRIQETQ